MFLKINNEIKNKLFISIKIISFFIIIYLFYKFINTGDFLSILYEIALTDMTREEQIRLLNIIKEKGISLREGSESIKVYYEIAKASFLEGLAKGLKL